MFDSPTLPWDYYVMFLGVFAIIDGTAEEGLDLWGGDMQLRVSNQSPLGQLAPKLGF